MIISLYAHGMTVRDILHHLDQVYGTKLSHEQVSRITDQVMDEVRTWQDQPLDPVAVVFLDAIVVKVRDNHVVHNKPAYLAVGIRATSSLGKVNQRSTMRVSSTDTSGAGISCLIPIRSSAPRRRG